MFAQEYNLQKNTVSNNSNAQRLIYNEKPDVYSCRAGAIVLQCMVTHNRQNKGYSLTTQKENFSQYVYNLQVPKPVLGGQKNPTSEHLVQTVCTSLWRFDRASSKNYWRKINCQEIKCPEVLGLNLCLLRVLNGNIAPILCTRNFINNVLMGHIIFHCAIK